MSKICCDIKNLGCFSHCGCLVLPLQARQHGQHVIEYFFNGATHVFNAAGQKGKPLVVDNNFNENGKAIIKIIQPDGTPFIWYENPCLPCVGEITECFELDIRPTYRISSGDACQQLLDLCNTCEDDCSTQMCDMINDICKIPITTINEC